MKIYYDNTSQIPKKTVVRFTSPDRELLIQAYNEASRLGHAEIFSQWPCVAPHFYFAVTIDHASMLIERLQSLKIEVCPEDPEFIHDVFTGALFKA